MVRTAGQVLDDAVLGSLEYASGELKTPLIMVLGHDSCGAITATHKALVEGEMPGGFIRNLVEGILPSVISPELPEGASINDMVVEHTRQTAARIAEQSGIIREGIEDGSWPSLASSTTWPTARPTWSTRPHPHYRLKPPLFLGTHPG